MTQSSIEYTGAARTTLCLIAAAGFFLVDGASLYGTFVDPAAVDEAMANPITLALMLEAFLLMGALAWLLTRWEISRLHWGWFIVLSLLESIAFALPVVLLCPGRRDSVRNTQPIDSE